MNWFLWIAVGIVVAIATIYVATMLQFRKGESFSLPIPLLAGLLVLHFGFGVELVRYALFCLDGLIILGALVFRLIENRKRKAESTR